MKKWVDCLFIGHNEMDFAEYEKSVGEMGVNSGAYRDLGKNFIRYNNRPYHASEVFSRFCGNHGEGADSFRALKIGENFSPAIAYLATWLNRRGLTFDYVNSFQEEKEELAKKLARENLLTIAIITTLYVTVFPILEIVRFIKQHNKSAKIIVGGPFVSNQIRKLSEADVDYLFKSIGADFFVDSCQGEAALVKIIHALKNRLPADAVENIYYKNHKGGGYEYAATAAAQENNKLTENMVDWNLFPGRIKTFASVRFSISCPFSCAFCGFPEHAGPFQTAGIEDIEKELNMLDKAGVRCVQIIDDTLNVPKKRFKEFLRMLIKNKYQFQWHAHLRCQFADREMIELMKESGCEGVFLGIESGSDEILKNMNKVASVKKYLHGIHLLKEYELLTYGSFIIGFPGETEKTVEQTVTFIKESGIRFFRTQLWYCDPVTPIWKQKEKYNIKGSHFEWSHATMNAGQACDIIDGIFLSIEEPTWVPQYNFEFDQVFHLLHRGFTLQQVENFIKAFNRGIKEKLRDPAQKEVSFEVIKQLRKAFQSGAPREETGSQNSKKNNFEAEFDL